MPGLRVIPASGLDHPRVVQPLAHFAALIPGASGWRVLMRILVSSGTITEGTNRRSEVEALAPAVLRPFLVWLAGAAFQPTGRVAGVSVRAALQRSSAISIATRFD